MANSRLLNFLDHQLLAEEEEGYIIRISLSLGWSGLKYARDASAALDQLETELREYESGSRKVLTVPWRVQEGYGGAWIYRALARIPYGGRISYGALASLAGKPRAIRAAASWCRKNPLPILLPCHRVIRKDGSPGRYSLGDSLKTALLELECDYD